jgi:hypothetical protein
LIVALWGDYKVVPGPPVRIPISCLSWGKLVQLRT